MEAKSRLQKEKRVLMKKKSKMDMNIFAKLVTQMEGKKFSISQAQVKEVLRCVKDLCASDQQAFKTCVKYLMSDM